jgi:predicted anti-sigma-YlaC factor YlaD
MGNADFKRFIYGFVCSKSSWAIVSLIVVTLQGTLVRLGRMGSDVPIEKRKTIGQVIYEVATLGSKQVLAAMGMLFTAIVRVAEGGQAPDILTFALATLFALAMYSLTATLEFFFNDSSKKGYLFNDGYYAGLGLYIPLAVGAVTLYLASYLVQ